MGMLLPRGRVPVMGAVMEELNATIDNMLEVKDLIAQHKFELKRLEQQEELLELKLVGFLKKQKVDEMVLPNCHFGFKVAQRTAFDQKLFSKEHPELFDKYKLTKETERFEFKIGGS